MHIREATPTDNEALQALQARCPMGTGLIVSTVNTPDFFVRAKAYESSKVFVACEDSQIVGSAACTTRDALVNGRVSRVAYQFQTFVSPDYRRKGIGKLLHERGDDYARRQGAILTFRVIMEGNVASMRLAESLGSRLHRTLVMAMLAVYKVVDVPTQGSIRVVTPEDLGAIAELLDETWRGHDLYQPASAEALARFISRTPAYSFDSLFVLEDHGDILACLGFWDWSRIMRVTVQALDLRLRTIALMADITRHFLPAPRAPKAGAVVKQWCLTPIGFKGPEHLAALFRHINNLALQRGIDQIFCICERNHALLSATKGLFRTDVGLHVYVKPLQGASLGQDPVFLDGIDL